MHVFYKGQPAEVWKISRTNEQRAWVKEAFEKNYLTWLDNRLRIVMAGLYPPMIKSLEDQKPTIFHEQGDCFDVTLIGYPGDYLDATNHRIVSKRKFLKQYQVQEGYF